MPLNLTELLLLIIVIAGAVYAGYMLGRWSVQRELARGQPDNDGGSRPSASPLPGPSESTWEAPRRSAAPPPASAGGAHADAAGGYRPAPRSTAPPASAGPAAGPGASVGQAGQPRRSVAPPPARAGLMDTGSTEDGADRSKPGGPAGKPGKRST